MSSVLYLNFGFGVKKYVTTNDFGIVPNHQKLKKHDEAMKNVNLIF